MSTTSDIQENARLERRQWHTLAEAGAELRVCAKTLAATLNGLRRTQPNDPLRDRSRETSPADGDQTHNHGRINAESSTRRFVTNTLPNQFAASEGHADRQLTP